ncbi:integrase [Paraburkholderia sp. GAS199]
MPTSLPTGVRLRGSVYHLRVGIPDDIRHLWPRRKDGSLAVDAYRASLKTSDRNEAAARAHAVIAELKRQFEDKRAGMRPAPFTPITDELIAYICDRETRTILAFDDGLRFNPEEFAQLMRQVSPTKPGWLSGVPVRNTTWDAIGSYLGDTQYEHLAALHRAIVYGIRADLSRGRLDTAQHAAQQACKSLGIVVDWGQPSARMALARVMRAVLKAWEGAEARDSGEAVATPVEPKKPVTVIAPEKPVTLRDVIPNWITRNTPKQDSIRRATRAVTMFEQVVGVKPLADLTKSNGAAFVRFLLDPERKIVRKTASNIAAAITAMLNVAVKDDLLASNPFDLTFDKTIGSQKREPWTDDELKLMLSSSLFTDQMAQTPRWQKVDAEDGRALLLILLHTGARIGEVAQLRREDFVRRSGLTAFRFTVEAGDIKNSESERTTPLAQHLLDNPWFSAWLSNTLGGTGPAFPSFCGRANPPGDIAGRWFLKFREVTGLPPGDLKGSHRFRHSLRTWLSATNGEKRSRSEMPSTPAVAAMPQCNSAGPALRH